MILIGIRNSWPSLRMEISNEKVHRHSRQGCLSSMRNMRIGHKLLNSIKRNDGISIRHPSFFHAEYIHESNKKRDFVTRHGTIRHGIDICLHLYSILDCNYMQITYKVIKYTPSDSYLCIQSVHLLLHKHNSLR